MVLVVQCSQATLCSSFNPSVGLALTGGIPSILSKLSLFVQRVSLEPGIAWASKPQRILVVEQQKEFSGVLAL